MSKKLSWLHLSDIHFLGKTAWRDDPARVALLKYLEHSFASGDLPKPDLVFCTGDIAFGETSAETLAKQYEQARLFFDAVLKVCGEVGKPIQRSRLFVVPGNHDINRKAINEDAQETLKRKAEDSAKHVAGINQRFSERSSAHRDAMQRQDEYAAFIADYLPHQADPDGRHCYANLLEINGSKVGIAGFNSAWSCAGPEDDRHLWLAAEWQFNAAKQSLKDADLNIGLMHHPVDWLNATEQDTATRRIAADFHFWLHGHTHNAWVAPGQTHITVAAGAVGASHPDEFGINLVTMDLVDQRGIAYLHAYIPKSDGWVIAPVAQHAPNGKWPFDLPRRLAGLTAPTSPPQPTVPTTQGKRDIRVFGREALLKEASRKLTQKPVLLVYGLRGNGKSTLIEELGKQPPLNAKQHLRFAVTAQTNAEELFRQVATLLGDGAEFPKPPMGSHAEIMAALKSRYPNPRPAWIWIDRAHLLLNGKGFAQQEVGKLLLALQNALPTQWHWLFELRERPPQGLLGQAADECEVQGLDKNSFAECLRHNAPEGQQEAWRYSGDTLRGLYGWLGGGHGNQAHPQAMQLLIEVARGHHETPLQVFARHRGDFERKVEDLLLQDLFGNVLSAAEQTMLRALALYRTAIPHDHADLLQTRLNIPAAWDGLDRRCLLGASPNHSEYFLHSFIADWLRTGLGYAAQQQEVEPVFAARASAQQRDFAEQLHAHIAECWLLQLGNSVRMTPLNIMRAMEAFYHLTAAAKGEQVQKIAVELLMGNVQWAIDRIKLLDAQLHASGASPSTLRPILEYGLLLEPENYKYLRLLGEGWRKQEGAGSVKARNYLERACDLAPGFAPYWTSLGTCLLSGGKAGAQDFLRRLDIATTNHPRLGSDEMLAAVRCDALTKIGDVQAASAMRQQHLKNRSHNAAFYVDEAKACLDRHDPHEAERILGLAARRGIDNDYTKSMLANVLDAKGENLAASALRQQQISSGSRNCVFYNDEAKACLARDDWRQAELIVALAEQRGIADDHLKSIVANIERARLAQAAPLQGA